MPAPCLARRAAVAGDSAPARPCGRLLL